MYVIPGEAPFVLIPPRARVKRRRGDCVPFEGSRLLPPMAGGAETFSDEGLTRILNIYPRATVSPDTTLYLFLFTSQTASTVPAQTFTMGASPTGVTEETSAGAYARAAVASTAWGAPATSGSGDRTTTSSAISFATSSGAYGAVVNGFGLTTASAAGAGDTGIGAANFSDTTAITVNAAGFTIRITPFWHYDA